MSWRFIDTHCHFDFPPFTGDERASIQRACEAGVEKIIVPATEAAHFPRVLALAARFPSLYAALGLHPIVIERHADDDPDKLQQALAQQQNVVAVGEIGLDLYRDAPQFARQERFLDAQLQLAKRYDLPRTGVVHGFAGSLQQAERFVRLGYKIGVGGTITYPRASKTRDVMARLPLDALLLETDAPDMPLKGFQGQPNRPEQAARVFDALCELRPEPAEVIADTLYRNTITLFRL
ncbi:TPA: TatD family hydrolase [Salmonella enterica subsp. enterica serovar Hartford]|nr:TatD family hydrolase [Salmonella enterica subsp. enterica serovar Hartford]